MTAINHGPVTVVELSLQREQVAQLEAGHDVVVPVLDDDGEPEMMVLLRPLIAGVAETKKRTPDGKEVVATIPLGGAKSLRVTRVRHVVLKALLAARDSEVTASDLIRRTGLAHPSVHRSLAELQNHRLVTSRLGERVMQGGKKQRCFKLTPEGVGVATRLAALVTTKN